MPPDACFAPEDAKQRWKAEVDDFAARKELNGQ